MREKIKNFLKKIGSLFKIQREIKLGFYGPPNAGKTSLANKICLDWIGEELGKVSKIPHETREIQFKEKVLIEKDGKKIEFKIIDTPGIATRIDFEDFLKFGLNKKEAQERAREATKGIIEAIKWLDDMDAVVIVLDSSANPYTQVNVTIIGNLAARKIPLLIVANKIDLKKSDVKKIMNAFPEYPVVGVSARTGEGMDKFYEELFKLVKKTK
ncbi:MAG: Era-like GTP-binding protein [Candidatus Pacearchaeota archaeon]